jgi:competence protein ComGC
MLTQIKNWLLGIFGIVSGVLLLIVSNMRRKNSEEKAKQAEGQKKQLENYVKVQNEIENKANEELEDIKKRADNDKRDVDF